MEQKKENGKKGLLLCVCQGTCPSFQKMEPVQVLNAIRREGLVDFVALHPQLCADDGDAYLKSILNDKGIDKLFVAGCAPAMQRKMFKEAFTEAGFNPENHLGVDIRNMTTDEAADAVKRLVKGTEERG